MREVRHLSGCDISRGMSCSCGGDLAARNVATYLVRATLLVEREHHRTGYPGGRESGPIELNFVSTSIDDALRVLPAIVPKYAGRLGWHLIAWRVVSVELGVEVIE